MPDTRATIKPLRPGSVAAGYLERIERGERVTSLDMPPSARDALLRRSLIVFGDDCIARVCHPRPAELAEGRRNLAWLRLLTGETSEAREHMQVALAWES